MAGFLNGTLLKERVASDELAGRVPLHSVAPAAAPQGDTAES